MDRPVSRLQDTRGQRQVKILVAGTGAVGSFYGAKLGQSGADVGFLCRSDYTLVLQKGVEIESVWGNFHYTPSVVVSSAAAYRDHSGAADIVLVALKSLPCIDVQAIIRDAVGPGTSVVLLQNGIGIEQSVAAAFPANEILSGIAFVCINRVGPGRIRHTDYGRVVIGRYQAGMSERLAAIAMMLERAGIPTRIAADIVMERWVKLVWNAPFNPLSVLCGGVTTRDILDSPECTLVARRVMEEIVAVAAAEGFVLPADIIDKNMADTARMEPYKTSMCLDYESGRPLEVDAILGRVVDIARRRCVPVPHIETTYAILSAVAARMTPCRQPGE